MKNKSEIELAIKNLDDKPDLRGMSYKQGLQEALEWVLDEIDDSESYPLDGISK